MQQVEIRPLPLQRLAELLEPDRAARLRDAAVRGRAVLDGRVVWNVSATAQGGGVAEMLQALLAYALGAGVDTRWLVLVGDPAFFETTKRLHNVLHGEPGDRGPLGASQKQHYDQVLARNLDTVRQQIRPGDLVLLHDPQAAGLAQGMKSLGAQVIWRSHIGVETTNEWTEAGWSFLAPELRDVDAFIFSRKEYAPDWVDPGRMRVIPPSIDPLSVKNRDLSPDQVAAIIRRAGLVADGRVPAPVGFTRRDGSPGEVREHSGLLVGHGAPPADAPLVLQVSRWDRLKDMTGVLTAFAEHLSRDRTDVHLMLAGPDVTGVSDDPEGAQVLAECTERWRALPADVRERVHLAQLPMDDVDENAVMVNALQRHALVVAQKSLVEGFGLTVTEALWKGTPVVASAVGGISDQIVDGRDGLLLDDPRDLPGFAALLRRVLDDAGLAARLGAGGRARALDQFLGDRHLAQYVDLFAGLIG